MKKVQRIVDYGLCLGCGLCEAVSNGNGAKMIVNSAGFYIPKLDNLDKKDEKLIIQICPGINVIGNRNINSSVWGNNIAIREAWSTDHEIRKKGSSGGVISAIGVYLIENNYVDSVLQVGNKDGSYLYNKLNISKTRDEILNNIASRYAPALIFDKIIEILNGTQDNFAFIGKPCDIAGLKNFLNKYSKYRSRFPYMIALFCAGMPSYNGTLDIIKLAGNNTEPVAIKYRGDGWPGMFEAKFRDGQKFSLSYQKSWGDILGKKLNFRCKICPDGIGLLADLAIGDSWNTKDGYPDFEEGEGKSFVMIRTQEGNRIFNNALKQGVIATNNLDIRKIKDIQSYQYQRRLLVGYRILPIYFLTYGMLRFRKLGIFRIMFKANFKQGILNLLGTLKRFLS